MLAFQQEVIKLKTMWTITLSMAYSALRPAHETKASNKCINEPYFTAVIVISTILGLLNPPLAAVQCSCKKSEIC